MTAPDEDVEIEEPEETEDGETARIHSLDSINEKLDSLASKIANLAKGRPRAPATQAGGKDPDGVAEQVRSELAKVQAQQKREDRVSKLETAVTKLTEQPPKEYRKVTQWLWGDE